MINNLQESPLFSQSNDFQKYIAKVITDKNIIFKVKENIIAAETSRKYLTLTTPKPLKTFPAIWNFKPFPVLLTSSGKGSSFQLKVSQSSIGFHTVQQCALRSILDQCCLRQSLSSLNLSWF